MADKFFSGKIYETQRSCLTKPMVLVKIYRPITGPVNYSKYLDFHGDNPVWDNKRRIGYDQLAGASDPARSTDLRMFFQESSSFPDS